MLNDLLDEYILIYIGDFLIYSRSEQEHVGYVK